MKKILVWVILVVLVIGGVWLYKDKHPSLKDNLKTLNETMTSYELSGTLEMVYQDALKTIDVTSMYKKEQGQDYYYVRLEDHHTHQVQTIVRNKEGVFVYSQGFNRPFQFKSEWPNNRYKPYILSSIFSLDFTEEKIQDGKILSAVIQEKTYPNVTHMQVLFDQHHVMKLVSLFDDNNQQVLKFDVITYMINPEIDTDLFVLDSSEEVSSMLTEVLPLYPMHLDNVELIDQLQLSLSLVLRYQGEHYFTLVETPLDKIDDVIEATEVYLLEDGFIYICDQEVSCIKNGMCTTIYATDLTFDEKLNILTCLENSIVIDS